MTQSNDDLAYVVFNSKLRSYEETEKFDNKPKSDNVMEVNISAVACYGCGNRGHIAKDCPQKAMPKWCNYHRSSTHTDETCRRKIKPDSAKQTMEIQEDSEEDGPSFVFQASQHVLPDHIKQNGLMVDCGAASHIITEENTFV